ncbi:MAG TPA: biotin--[acetyl-CoA-carboxylase] ligase [Vicinamibacterales bacterium]|nr:biotin--[acetyl-CoA-carboxylase] ligase [Vicinamibacterales bacterium]
MRSNPFDLPLLGRLGTEAYYFPSIGSTNDFAASLPEGAVVVADEQTAGRGRRGHTWFSPAGSGLYVSVVLAPRLSIDPRRATAILTLAAGVGISEGIDLATGLRVDLKWPNDLFVGPRKLGGILAEASVSGDAIGTVVLGFGINVRPTAYPSDIADRASSLETELGRQVDRHHLLVETLTALAHRYDDLLAGRFDAILDAWRARAPRAVDADVTWTSASGPLTGRTAGIDADGALLVKIEGRVERIVAGEVLWL